MSAAIKTAHYFAGRGRKYVVISDGFSPVRGLEINVSGKAEARRIAAEHGAKCWNF